MKASLDTSVIINLYRADQEDILFDLFSDGIFVHSFIVDVELKNHGQDIKDKFMNDVESGKVQIIDDHWLEAHGLLSLFRSYFEEERLLYDFGDKGEVCAIALARTLGVMSVVTDDTKQRGPHATLMRLPNTDVIPFAFYEVLFLLFLSGNISAEEVVEKFEAVVNSSQGLSLLPKAKLKAFVKRFSADPYSEREKLWMEAYCEKRSVNFIERMRILNKILK